MEYLNKFRSTVSSTVSSVAQQVSQSLPVTLLIKTFNSIFREIRYSENMKSKTSVSLLLGLLYLGKSIPQLRTQQNR